MDNYQKLKDEFNRKYNYLYLINGDTDSFDEFKDYLKLPESQYLEYYNLEDIEEWIDDLNELIERREIENRLYDNSIIEDYVEGLENLPA